MSRSAQKAEALRVLGADAVVADALDRSAVIAAISQAAPDAVIHQLTALTRLTAVRNFDKSFAQTNRLRTDGTDHLLAGARAASVRRFVAQSYGSWNYARTGAQLKIESDEFDPAPPKHQTASLRAITYLEEQVLGAKGIEGIVLRYGSFYGPGTSISQDGDIAELVRKRRFPILGDGGGVWSFVHVADAATATADALERGSVGVYNIADDEPARVADYLPALAQAIGAKPPRHLPVWLGRLFAGEVAVSLMTQIRGASNAKAKRELGWAPQYPSYREGFRTGLGTAASAGADG